MKSPSLCQYLPMRSVFKICSALSCLLCRISKRICTHVKWRFGIFMDIILLKTESSVTPSTSICISVSTAPSNNSNFFIKTRKKKKIFWIILLSSKYIDERNFFCFRINTNLHVKKCNIKISMNFASRKQKTKFRGMVFATFCKNPI